MPPTKHRIRKTLSTCACGEPLMYRRGDGRLEAYCPVQDKTRKRRTAKRVRSANKGEVARLWRTIVMSRAKWVCEICGMRVHDQGQHLPGAGHAHHIVPKSRSSLLRYDVRNGACVCRDCHSRAHGRDSHMVYLALAAKRAEDCAYLADKMREAGHKWTAAKLAEKKAELEGDVGIIAE